MYLEIEKIRFKQKLDLAIDVDTESEQIEIPGFLLQPLVENAIYHGLTKQIEAKKLEITIVKKEGMLLIDIYNDGPPLPAGFRPENSSGVGLSSTVDRLNQFFGENHKLTIENHRSGVMARLELPIA